MRAGHRARRPRAHLGRLRRGRRGRRPLRRGDPHRAHPRQRPDRGRRARRRLQRAGADVLARLRHLGRIDAPPRTSTTASCSTSRSSRAGSRRRSGSASRRRRSSTPARSARCGSSARPGCCSSPTPTPRRAASPTRCAAPARAPRPCSVLGERRARAGRGDGPRRRRAADGARRGSRGRRRAAAPCSTPRRRCACSPSIPSISVRELALPFLDPRKRVARFPEDPHRRPARRRADHRRHRLGGLAGRGAHRRRRARSRSSTTRSCPTRPIVDPRLTLTMPPRPDRGHGRRRAHARARGLRLDLRVALHRRVVPPGRAADPRRAAARVRRRRATSPRARGWPTARRSRASRSPTPSSASTTRSPTPSARASAIAHGRANALFLPHVLRYNAAMPTQVHAGARLRRLRRRRTSTPRWPGCSGWRRAAPERAVRARRRAARPSSACRAPPPAPGVDPDAYRAAVPELAMAAFGDLSLRTNPRMPLVAELRELLESV